MVCQSLGKVIWIFSPKNFGEGFGGFYKALEKVQWMLFSFVDSCCLFGLI